MKTYTFTKNLLLWSTCLINANIQLAAMEASALVTSDPIGAQKAGTRIYINKEGSSEELAIIARDSKMAFNGGRAWGVTRASTLGDTAGSSGTDSSGVEVVFARSINQFDKREFHARNLGHFPPIDENGNCLLSQTERDVWYCDYALINIYTKHSDYYLGIRDLSDALHDVIDGKTLNTLAGLARVIERNKEKYATSEKVNQAITLIPPMIKKIITLYRTPNLKRLLESDMATILTHIDAVKGDCERYICERGLEKRVPLPSDAQVSLLNIEGIYATDAIQASVQLGKLLKMIKNKATLKDHSNAISDFFKKTESLSGNSAATADLIDISGLSLTFNQHKDFFENEHEWASTTHSEFNSFLESVETINRLLKAIEGYLEAASTVQFSLSVQKSIDDTAGAGAAQLAITNAISSDALTVSATSSSELATHFLHLHAHDQWKLEDIKRDEQTAREKLSEATKRTDGSYEVSIMGDLQRAIDEATRLTSL